MPMLYDYSGPGAFTPVPVCPSSGPAEGPLIRLESLCHFDAVSTYRVIRDGLPELLFAYTQGGEGRLTYQGVAIRCAGATRSWSTAGTGTATKRRGSTGISCGCI